MSLHYVRHTTWALLGPRGWIRLIRCGHSINIRAVSRASIMHARAIACRAAWAPAAGKFKTRRLYKTHHNIKLEVGVEKR